MSRGSNTKKTCGCGGRIEQFTPSFFNFMQRQIRGDGYILFVIFLLNASGWNHVFISRVETGRFVVLSCVHSGVVIRV